ncbi:DUF998 domain-containing protein [Dehalogenimonas sp. 4OHTPN]|uniref:DUF998 domain-containing protein n=1 Tax=Dehalogenimonas sp. 4OHTPN TaxID=3166643 RepID=A0AAU8GCE3_9CHLR
MNISVRRMAIPKAAASRAADAACLGFPLLFMAATTALETIQPGFDRVANTISELVWGPFGWVEAAMFACFAAVMALSALRLREAALPLGLAAAGFMLIAVFPTQAPGGGQTAASLIHELSAQTIAALLPAACFCLAYRLRKDPAHRAAVSFSVTAGIIGTVFNAAGFVAVHTDAAWIGAIERLIMLNGLIWLELMTLLRWAAERPAVSMRTAAGIDNRAAAVRVDCCRRRDRR